MCAYVHMCLCTFVHLYAHADIASWSHWGGTYQYSQGIKKDFAQEAISNLKEQEFAWQEREGSHRRQRETEHYTFKKNSCHQQFSFKCPNIFHLKNLCKPIYYVKEVQPPVGLICLVNSVSKPAVGLATRKKGCSQCWIICSRTCGYDQTDMRGLEK